MRSRTSRGVPEVKIYIWEVLFWSPEKFRVLSVTYRDHREGPGGPPSGATSPGGLSGPRVVRDQPLSGLVHLPPLPKAQLGGERGNPRRRWAYRPTLGRAPSLPLSATPSKSHLGLAAAP